MAETQCMARLVQSNAEKIYACTNSPVFVVIEMHVARNGLAIEWRRIERVGQHSVGAVKGVAVAMISARKENGNSLVSSRVAGGCESELRVLGPLGERPHDF